MTDTTELKALVKRLRAQALPDPCDEREVMHAPLLREAADRLAELQEKLDRQVAICSGIRTDRRRLKAENDTLREQLQAAQDALVKKDRAIAMLNSIVLCGEKHSEKSEREVRDALAAGQEES